jgi:presenilin-like A22 family membrane protease
MKSRLRWGVALAALIFLLVQLGALALVPTFYEQGYQTVENPSDPTNSFLYVGAILVATAFMLGAFKFEFEWAVRGLIVFTSGLLSWYVFSAVLPPVPVTVGGVRVDALAAGLSLVVAGALVVYPEWYVIDTAGVLMGAGAAGLFGISFGLLPAVVLLGVLAVYDAISVYGTEHMLSLASGVMRLRIPVVLVIPLSRSYSLLDQEFDDEGTDDLTGEDTTPAESDGGERRAATVGARDSGDSDTARTDAGDGDHGGVAGGDDGEDDSGGVDGETVDVVDKGPVERDAFFIGLGDAVMPTVMVASAAFFSPAASLGVPFLPALNAPALAAMVGTFVGFGILMRAVAKGRPHAGLPLLNGGAILGYLLGSVAVGVSFGQALGLAAYL